ncbi:MAG: hypothetical protein ACERLG_00005 [Sedimentibacter sp.]
MENNNLKSKLETIAESKKENDEKIIIEFKEIVTFDWDRLYILTPYASPEEYAKEQNIEGINLINTDIDINDGNNLLIFVLDKKIVSYVNYPRSKGDFYNSIKYEQDGLTPDEAIFEVTEEKDWLKIININ